MMSAKLNFSGPESPIEYEMVALGFDSTESVSGPSATRKEVDFQLNIMKANGKQSPRTNQVVASSHHAPTRAINLKCIQHSNNEEFVIFTAYFASYTLSD